MLWLVTRLLLCFCCGWLRDFCFCAELAGKRMSQFSQQACQLVNISHKKRYKNWIKSKSYKGNERQGCQSWLFIASFPKNWLFGTSGKLAINSQLPGYFWEISGYFPKKLAIFDFQNVPTHSTYYRSSHWSAKSSTDHCDHPCRSTPRSPTDHCDHSPRSPSRSASLFDDADLSWWSAEVTVYSGKWRRQSLLTHSGGSASQSVDPRD